MKEIKPDELSFVAGGKRPDLSEEDIEKLMSVQPIIINPLGF